MTGPICVAMGGAEKAATHGVGRHGEQRLPSFYGRTIQDLPWSGCPVTINLRVRRFFCDNANCKRLVFCERLAPHSASYGRYTDRQRKRLQMLAVAMGGEMSARLLARLGLSGSPALLLNAITALMTSTRG